MTTTNDQGLPRPFSGDRFEENNGHSAPYTPCVLCGRGVRRPAGWLHVIDGGERYARLDASAIDEGSDMGEWPIGPDCLRRHSALRPYVRPVQPRLTVKK